MPGHIPTRLFAPVVSLVTERDDWASPVIELCNTRRLIAERWSWADASNLVEPGVALAIDVTVVDQRVAAAFQQWAALALQPQCIVSLESAPGTGGFATYLTECGFDRIVPAQDSASRMRELRTSLLTVVGSDAWLAPMVAGALACTEPAFVRSLAHGLELLPQHHTVQRWASAMGWTRRQDLEALFAAHALPSPKAILDHLRLARLVHLAGSTTPAPSRTKLAAQFGYSSGDYLGKRAKDLTGAPLGQLVQLGATAVIASLADLV